MWPPLSRVVLYIMGLTKWMHYVSFCFKLKGFTADGQHGRRIMTKKDILLQLIRSLPAIPLFTAILSSLCSWFHCLWYVLIKHPGHLQYTLTFLQFFISFIHVDASFLAFSLHRQIMAEFALVTFSTLALLIECTQHWLWVNTYRNGRRETQVF